MLTDEQKQKYMFRGILGTLIFITVLGLAGSGSRTPAAVLEMAGFWAIFYIIYRLRHAFPTVVSYVRTIHSFLNDLDRVPSEREKQLVPDAQVSHSKVQLSAHENVEFLKITKAFGSDFGKK